MTPLLEDKYKIVLFDYVGCGKSDLTAYSKERYANLAGYAQDVIEICQDLNLTNVIFVGHSVSSIIGCHAAIIQPELFKSLVMVCPSPCFLNFPPDYIGGFEKDDLQELLNLMDKNYIGWANYLAPLVMGQNSEPKLISELELSFCSTDPKFAKPFAEATFFSDDRETLSQVNIPSLILQSTEDNLASVAVGEFIHNQMSQSTFAVIEAHGHCLHMTNPEEITKATLEFLST